VLEPIEVKQYLDKRSLEKTRSPVLGIVSKSARQEPREIINPRNSNRRDVAVIFRKNKKNYN
jgi:hypothetical protein